MNAPGGQVTYQDAVAAAINRKRQSMDSRALDRIEDKLRAELRELYDEAEVREYEERKQERDQETEEKPQVVAPVAPVRRRSPSGRPRKRTSGSAKMRASGSTKMRSSGSTKMRHSGRKQLRASARRAAVRGQRKDNGAVGLMIAAAVAVIGVGLLAVVL